MTRCPTDDALARMLDGGLTPVEFGPLEAHLEDCPRCQVILDRLTASADTAWMTPARADVKALAPAPGIPGIEIREEIGRGGHGVVFRAYQPALERTVAVKVLRNGAFATADERKRFLGEALAAARLRHPNIAQVFAAGEENGSPHLVLEYVAGISLAVRLRAGPLAPWDAAGVVEAVARAVDHAHRQGVIHRDLKPGNVLLDGGTLTRPVVTDFGLARRLDAGDGPTATADALGTPSYMAPELATGGAKVAGPAVDVYALGAVLYECLLGHPPFRGASPFETLLLVREQAPVPPRRFLPGLDRDLETVCLKCLEKSPAERYPTAEALANDLRRYLDHRPIVAARPGLIRRAGQYARRHRYRSAGAAAAALAILATAAGGVWHGQRLSDAHDAERAADLVRALQTADTPNVAALVRELEPHRRRADPLLDDAVRSTPADSRERLHAAMAVADRDPAQAEYLVGRLLAANPGEIGPISDALGRHRHTFRPRLRAIVGDPAEPPGRRMRAAGAVAKFEGDAYQIGRFGPFAATYLAAENPVHLSAWVALLRPVMPQIGPDLARVVTDPLRPEAERVQAAAVMADTGCSGRYLIETACDADPRAFAVLFPLLQTQPAESLSALKAVLARRLTDGATEADRVAFARRHAAAAIASARLGESAPLWENLDHSPDPTVRSYIVARAGSCGVAAEVFAAEVLGRRPVAVRRAAVLALGNYPPDAVPPERRAAVAAGLLAAYRTDPDAGFHSAVDWLLRQKWEYRAEIERIDRNLAGRPAEHRGWFVDRYGTTFAVFAGPITSVCGSPEHEAERSRRNEGQVEVRIPRTFALATRKVSVGQFMAYRLDGWENPFGPWAEFSQQFDRPTSAVTAVDAMRFCRRLDEGRRLPTCMQTYGVFEGDSPAVQLPPNYLSRPGYRLPTEAEWEFAARAGTTTARFYGHGTELMGGYAWTLMNSGERLHAVGSKMPNDAGLFDALGAVWDLCHPTHSPDRSVRYPDDGRGAGFAPAGDEAFCGRGGSYLYLPSFSRSAMKYFRPMMRGDRTVGFRLALTITALPQPKPEHLK